MTELLCYLELLGIATERERFEAVYLQYRGLMLYVARKMLHSEEDAEDAVHQAFLSILQHIEKISVVDCPETRAYVVTITERKAIDLIRKRQREQASPLAEDIPGLPIPLPGDHGLADAMAQLPAQYREVLLLRYDSGFSVREIAKAFGRSIPGTQKLIWRAKAALAEKLSEVTQHEI